MITSIKQKIINVSCVHDSTRAVAMVSAVGLIACTVTSQNTMFMRFFVVAI
jgi:hypothetical protein